ncbi:MAG: nucleotidyltransferase domain-containing protein [Anaerolineae bacterium]|nr:nucleotidyltransferase domain-containing protein [Anaerolineae bacterium]
MGQDEMARIRRLLSGRKAQHTAELASEMTRLTTTAAALGVDRVILFGSMVQGEPGLGSDLDLLVVWDTPLDFLARTAELYRRLQPRVAVDLLVYTPEEMVRMAGTPFIQRALKSGRVLYEA